MGTHLEDVFNVTVIFHAVCQICLKLLLIVWPLTAFKNMRVTHCVIHTSMPVRDGDPLTARPSVFS